MKGINKITNILARHTSCRTVTIEYTTAADHHPQTGVRRGDGCKPSIPDDTDFSCIREVGVVKTSRAFSLCCRVGYMEGLNLLSHDENIDVGTRNSAALR